MGKSHGSWGFGDWWIGNLAALFTRINIFMRLPDGGESIPRPDNSRHHISYTSTDVSGHPGRCLTSGRSRNRPGSGGGEACCRLTGLAGRRRELARKKDRELELDSTPKSATPRRLTPVYRSRILEELEQEARLQWNSRGHCRSVFFLYPQHHQERHRITNEISRRGTVCRTTTHSAANSDCILRRCRRFSNGLLPPNASSTAVSKLNMTSP